MLNVCWRIERKTHAYVSSCHKKERTTSDLSKRSAESAKIENIKKKTHDDHKSIFYLFSVQQHTCLYVCSHCSQTYFRMYFCRQKTVAVALCVCVSKNTPQSMNKIFVSQMAPIINRWRAFVAMLSFEPSNYIIYDFAFNKLWKNYALQLHVCERKSEDIRL